jgi:hypothetical protein
MCCISAPLQVSSCCHAASIDRHYRAARTQYPYRYVELGRLDQAAEPIVA